MHPEIQRAQSGILNVLHSQQERLALLSKREIEELRHEAEEIQRRANGSLRGAADITHSICVALLKAK